MWRLTRFSLDTAIRQAKLVTESIRQRTPYQQLLRAMEQGNAGLLTAAEIFRQFETYYRHSVKNQNITTTKETTHFQDSTMSSTHPTTNVNNITNTLTPTEITSNAKEKRYEELKEKQMPLKPLTEFCVVKEEVEPLTIMLLKVLCDLQRLEEMRFLFTQCILELDQSSSPPSCELFNVYLLAISMTDTFNRNEIENVVELMHTRQVIPDVVTKLSVYILYLRLGLDCNPSWWEAIREEIKTLINNQMTDRYSLLPLRLQHCFQTLMRLHYDVHIIHECFTLLHAFAPERLPHTLLIPYLLLSNLNAAAPPETVISILTLLEEQQEKELQLLRSREVSEKQIKSMTDNNLVINTDDKSADKGNKNKSSKEENNREASTLSKTSCTFPHDASHTYSTINNNRDGNVSVSTNTNCSTLNSINNVLHNEVTIFRILSKCAKYKDAVSARWVRLFVERQEKILTETAKMTDWEHAQYSEITEQLHEDNNAKSYNIIPPQNAPIAALLYLETLAHSNELNEGFTVVEKELTSPFNRPLERKKVTLAKKRSILLHSDPVNDFITAITRYSLECENGEKLRGTEAVLFLLRQQMASNNNNNSSNIIKENNDSNNNNNNDKHMESSSISCLIPCVSCASYNLLMAAYAVEHNYIDGEALLEEMKESNSHIHPNAETYAHLINTYAHYDAAQTAVRIKELLNEMSSNAISVTSYFINTALKVVLANGDCGTALYLLDKSAEHHLIVEPRQSMHLLHELSRLCDFFGVQRAVRYLQISHSPIDRKTLLQCLIYMRSNGVECMSVEALLK